MWPLMRMLNKAASRVVYMCYLCMHAPLRQQLSGGSHSLIANAGVALTVRPT